MVVMNNRVNHRIPMTAFPSLRAIDPDGTPLYDRPSSAHHGSDLRWRVRVDRKAVNDPIGKTRLTLV